jgi:hypothetical protein
MNNKYKDMMGKEIVVGDYIVYAGLWSRSAMLKIGKVVALKQRKESYPEKTIPTLQVKGVELGWNNNLRPNSKISTLAFLDRLMVIPKEFVNQEFLNAIEKVDTKDEN